MKINNHLWTPLALIISTIIVCVFLYLRPVVYATTPGMEYMVKGFKVWWIQPYRVRQVYPPAPYGSDVFGDSQAEKVRRIEPPSDVPDFEKIYDERRKKEKKEMMEKEEE